MQFPAHLLVFGILCFQLVCLKVAMLIPKSCGQ